MWIKIFFIQSFGHFVYDNDPKTYTFSLSQASSFQTLCFVPDTMLDACDIVMSQNHCPCPQAAHSLVGDKEGSKQLHKQLIKLQPLSSLLRSIE